jgi:hypothetical protein
MANQRTSGWRLVPMFLVLVPLCGRAQTAIPSKYDLPELTEIARLDVAGPERGTSDRSTITTFRRSFYVDRQALVIQREENRQYYLLILAMPHNFSGTCAKRPQAIMRAGGTYFLMCNSNAIAIARTYQFDDKEQMERVTSALQP